MPAAAATSRGTRRKAAQDNAMSRGDEGKRALYHCNYCSRDISEVVRIKCAECPDFDLCVDCFSVGVELGDHKNTHAYRVMDHLSFPLFHPEWGADEELLLLEALEMYGVGNWLAVAEHVGMKTPQRCKQHFHEIYMDSSTSPLPQPCPELQEVDIGELMHRKVRPCEPEKESAKESRASKRALENADEGARPAHIPKVEEDANVSNVSAPGERAADAAEASEGPEAADAVPAEMQQDTAIEVPATNGKHKGGKTTKTTRPVAKGPQTGQEGGSGPPRIQHNKQEITGYMIHRDEFEPEYDAEAELPIADMEFNDNDPPEVTASKLRQLEIYNERLTERERRRELIKEHELVDVRRLMNAEKKRSPYDRRFHAAMRVFARFQDAPNHEALCEGLLLEARLRARIGELKQLRRAGARTFAEADALQEARKRSEAVAAGRPSGRPDRNATRALGAMDDAVPAPHVLSGGTNNPVWDLNGTGAVRGAAAALASWRSKRGAALDITSLPGTELLTKKERELCSSYRLLPAHYLLLKETLMREVELHGPLTRAEARGMFRLEPARAQRIHELAVAAGWCKALEKSSKGADVGMESGPE